MKRLIAFLLLGAAFLGAGWAAFRTAGSEGPALSRYVPAGAVLYLQAKDFSALLAAWNASPQKQQWVKSSNYEVFSRSRLFLRLKGASEQFTAAAGLPPDENFLAQVAGTQSALALYDIGKLQFLYVTKLSSAEAMQSALWQTRAKFEPRSAAGVTFYLRRDPESEREVAFAVNGDYLLLATREDLLTGALELLGGGQERSIEAESWWLQSVAGAGPAGDLRMVLNLEKLVPSPYFRSYWVQKKVTEMKQYAAGISDIFVTGKEFREERVLLKKSASEGEAVSGDGPAAVAELARLIPAGTGLYEVRATPSAESCAGLLETKILAPHSGPAVAGELAPQVQLTSGETGSSSDLETRIDQPPVQSSPAGDASAALKDLFQKNRVRAVLAVQSTASDKDGVFVRIHSGIALLGSADWSEAAVRSAIVNFLRPALTAGPLGVDWQAKSGYQELNGLSALSVAARGKYLLISDDPSLMGGMLANMNQKAIEKPAALLAGFSHARERDNFARLTGLLDRRNGATGSVAVTEQTPQFFCQNIGSLSSALSEVISEKIAVRERNDKVMHTVIYEWAR